MKFVSSSMNGRKYMSLPSRECGLKLQTFCAWDLLHPVTPFAGVWIEIEADGKRIANLNVTPFAGVWIEIVVCLGFIRLGTVTPFAGVWIEIIDFSDACISNKVTPFAGVWIEIFLIFHKQSAVPSLPSRECGLKYSTVQLVFEFRKSLPSRECGLKSPTPHIFTKIQLVTPFAGVWIEISYSPI